VDYFLFERRMGLADISLPAMALMLRLQHIPSRMVAGYLKGEWNEPAQSVCHTTTRRPCVVQAYIPETG